MSASYQRACLLFFHLRRHDLAERELHGVLGENPGHAQAHALLGLCLIQRRALKEAAGATAEALRLGPDLAFSHYVQARLLGARNRLHPAIKALEEAIRLQPQCADYFSWMAAFRYDLGHFRRALAAAEKGLEMDAAHVGCMNLRALALGRLGRTRKAKSASHASLARDPVNATSHAIQGTTFMRQGEFGLARASFTEALRLDPLSEWAHRGRRFARRGLFLVGVAVAVGNGLLKLFRRRRRTPNDPPTKLAGWLGCLILAAASGIVQVALVPGPVLGVPVLVYVVVLLLFAGAFDYLPRSIGKPFMAVVAVFVLGAPITVRAMAAESLRSQPYHGVPLLAQLGAAVAAGLLLFPGLFLCGIAASDSLAEKTLPRRKRA